MDLSKAVVLVTGGARGLGRGIAEACAARGARLAIADLNVKGAEAVANSLVANGGRALAFGVDVTSVSGTADLASQVADRLGPVDVLVNSAGILTGIGPVWEVDPVKWMNDVRVSLDGSFLCARAVLPQMMERRDGYVLNLYGGGGGEPQMYLSGYVAAKTGLLIFTECLAREVHEYGIKVFALRPGPVRTDLNSALIESEEGRRWRPDFGEMFARGEGVSSRLVIQLAERLVSGCADELSGRLIDAQDDLGALLDRAPTIVSSDLLKLRVRKN
jgi:3-oxoacyl-[acyl-carrier protein] reductase